MSTSSPERFAIVEIPHGTPPAISLIVGPLDMLMEQLPDTRARADALARLDAARLDAAQISQVQNVTRALQVAAFCDSVTRVSRRLDAFAARRAERVRAEGDEREAEEERAIEDALSKMPDPEQPHGWATDGELTTHPASEPEKQKEFEATEHKHPVDNEGDLPNELLEQVPPTTGTGPEFD